MNHPISFKMSFLQPDLQLPLVIEPDGDCSENLKLEDLWAWLIDNKSFLEEKLLQHGGILFRGFPVSTATDFNEFVHSIEPQTLPYIEGQSPRSKVYNQIYTSTEYPADQKITLHNELSYTHNPPRKIFFFCEVPAQSEGETPIADCRKAYAKMNPIVRDRFVEKQVCYVKNMCNGKGFGKSWQKTFETSERSEVENYLKERAIDFAWKKDGSLLTTQTHPAAIKHPDTQETCWFNQATLWHYTNFGSAGNDLMKLLGEKNLPTNAYYGDQTSIEPEDLASVSQLFWDEATLFSWQKGDVLMLDNILVAHGRNTYKGDRRILVAMA